jgi:hypothetical protein
MKIFRKIYYLSSSVPYVTPVQDLLYYLVLYTYLHQYTSKLIYMT